MCLIVYKENEDAFFSNRQFKNMLKRNEDGLGIMWRENGRVKVAKSVGNNKDKFNMWKSIREQTDQYAMHARLKTHGEIDIENCHPYKVLDIDDGDPIDMYMMHNGTISNAPTDMDKDKSDTWHFVEATIKPLAKAGLIDLIWKDAAFQKWISGCIAHSKLLFMRSDDVDNPVIIFNYEKGEELRGCWLSNVMCSPMHNYRYDNNQNWNRNQHRSHYAGYGGYHDQANAYYDQEMEDYNESVYGTGKKKVP